MKTHIKLVFLVAVLFSIVSLTSCKKEDDNPTDEITGSFTDTRDNKTYQ